MTLIGLSLEAASLEAIADLLLLLFGLRRDYYYYYSYCYFTYVARLPAVGSRRHGARLLEDLAAPSGQRRRTRGRLAGR